MTLHFPLARPADDPLAPPEIFRRLRDREPVTMATLWDGSRAWLVARHADVRAVLRDLPVSADITRPGFPRIFPLQQALPQGERPPFVLMDPPDHDVLRKLINADFVVRRIEALRPRIRRLVDEHVDAMLAGPRPADLVRAVALPVPSTVICWLLGVPVAEQGAFNEWTSTAIDATSTPERRAHAYGAIGGLLDRLLAEKEHRPGDDMLTRLARHVTSGAVSRHDALTTAMLILIAGHETTANMIALGTLTLLGHPEQADALRDDPGLAPNAVEELLRYLSIVDGVIGRVALEDFTLAGRQVRAGDGIVVLIPSANRDPGVFDDPDTLDLRRPARRHVAFGYGLHQCLGQPLARVELQVTLTTLLRRVPGLRLAVPMSELTFKQNDGVYGVRSLPLTWNEEN
ncbi:cytochrome P450 [Microtetraspora sp. NBRC 13810]|uniref:cytochrome P450 n=1 Tax=Microtetraspora sp. NBRC 13810 TaxID=3030990 RepID=UPI0024A4F76C|nr:cytochrome P450 [Microtetraspora sp. NBRC 13810]GLW11248.1 cytochrome P450 [Microtetraspora sp. NBRC 13810]